MNIVTSHVRTLIEKGIRFDGRKLDEYRKDVTVEYGISKKSAEGSARVKIGTTEVVAGVKFEVCKPYADTADQGSIIAGVELLPLSSSHYESGPPSIKAIELARAIVDRGIRESEAIDLKKLCIKKGEKSWTVLIDNYTINDAGNIADAIGLCAMAALKDARFPKYDEKAEKVIYEERTDKKVPLNELPIPITVIKIGTQLVVDPSPDEEAAMDARLTVTTTSDGKVCAMQKGGAGTLTADDVAKVIELSLKKGKELRKLIEK